MSEVISSYFLLSKIPKSCFSDVLLGEISQLVPSVVTGIHFIEMEEKIVVLREDGSPFIIREKFIYIYFKSMLTVEQEKANEERDEEMLLLNQSVDSLNLSTRATNCMRANEANTLGCLCSFARRSVLRWRNMGKGTLREIEDALSEKGLSLQEPHE